MKQCRSYARVAPLTSLGNAIASGYLLEPGRALTASTPKGVRTTL